MYANLCESVFFSLDSSQVDFFIRPSRNRSVISLAYMQDDLRSHTGAALGGEITENPTAKSGIFKNYSYQTFLNFF